ncbi:5625_t:CDS:2 [Paraglomus brasilianum]|uniref:5625_t:CDS:1 n=1 Tax=Paraglomus brasilianum TaxID=144538 RepID=A0A9N9E2C6_9GLOM|nr:5625_t:CDS:2 [Paraglomus brasilianum]
MIETLRNEVAKDALDILQAHFVGFWIMSLSMIMRNSIKALHSGAETWLIYFMHGDDVVENLYWPEKLENGFGSASAKHLHVSMMDIDQEHDRTAKRMCKIKAPSKMAKLTEFPSLQESIQLHCDRPNENYLAKPVVLYNPIFNQFLVECVNASVTD